nr:uncharacterized protein LOC112545191 isoform X2 [Pelodiscus sinensis]|eukprot:XP_025038615.1 uncharacterized protein LOC112545191 isoform X2 [Pelodiscus sinensis]
MASAQPSPAAEGGGKRPDNCGPAPPGSWGKSQVQHGFVSAPPCVLQTTEWARTLQLLPSQKLAEACDAVAVPPENKCFNKKVMTGSSDRMMQRQEARPAATEGQATPLEPAIRPLGNRKCRTVHKDLMREHVAVLCDMQRTLGQMVWDDAEWWKCMWDYLVQEGENVCPHPGSDGIPGSCPHSSSCHSSPPQFSSPCHP